MAKERLRSGFVVRLGPKGAEVQPVPRVGTWKPTKLQAVRTFLTDLHARAPRLRASFTLFAREKAPAPGGFGDPSWYVSARYAGQDYRLFPDYVAMRRGKVGSFMLHGYRASKVRAWSKRVTCAVYRATNDRESFRTKIAALSIEHASLLDASLVRHERPNAAADFSPSLLGSRLTPQGHACWRYVVNADSWGGLTWKLLSGSCVIELLDEALPWETWRHTLLRPWEHYVPATIETLIERIEWCKANDREAQKIALRGAEICRKEFGYDGALRFAERVLREQP